MNELPPTMLCSTSARGPLASARAVAAVTEFLTPYQAAAKAIFVKANGLVAYYEAAGDRRYSG